MPARAVPASEPSPRITGATASLFPSLSAGSIRLCRLTVRFLQGGGLRLPLYGAGGLGFGVGRLQHVAGFRAVEHGVLTDDDGHHIGAVRDVEHNRLQNLLHHGAQAAGTGAAFGGEAGNSRDRSVVEDQVSVNLADISDGHLHRFEYTTSGGVKVRFIVIQKSGSSFGVGLDACDICGPTGYYEKDGKVICKLCEVAMNIATIGFKGGCNPIPIDYKVSNGTLTVPISALEASASIFAK